MMQRGLSLELDGHVTVEFRREGLACSMDIPLPA